MSILEFLLQPFFRIWYNYFRKEPLEEMMHKDEMLDLLTQDANRFRKEDILLDYKMYKSKTIDKSMNNFKKIIQLFEEHGNPNDWIAPFCSVYGNTYEEQRRNILSLYIKNSPVSQDFFKEALDDLITISHPNKKEKRYLWFPPTKKYPAVKSFDTSNEENKITFKNEREHAYSNFIIMKIVQNDDLGYYLRDNGCLPMFTFEADKYLDVVRKVIEEYESQKNKEKYLAYIFAENPEEVLKYDDYILSFDEERQILYEQKNENKKEQIHKITEPDYRKVLSFLFQNQGIELSYVDIKEKLNIRNNFDFSDFFQNIKLKDKRKERYITSVKRGVLIFNSKGREEK